MKIYKYITAGFVTAVMGFATSCSEQDIPVNNVTGDDDLVDVTINFVTENAAGTRALVDDGFVPVISTGSEIDKLIYAVYDGKTGNLLTSYKVDPTDGLGAGQNSMVFHAGETKSIVLKVNKANSYKIACWAQSEKCDAFTTTDLKNVTVSYDKASNNDELRDAFCGASEPFLGGTTDDITIILRRPFAQINVGTTGADYRVSAKIPGGTHYTYSKIKLNSVANTIDVYNDVISGETKDVTFDFNQIPAYWQETDMTELTASELNYGKNGEEFLLVDLDKDGKYQPFRTNYSTMTAKDKYLTETFKYMSMCYVLVPSSTTKADDVNGSNVDITLTFAGDAEGKEVNGVNSEWTLTSVPVARNYRTNILGGLKYFTPEEREGNGEDPKDPWTPSDDPDDPNYDPTYDPEDPDSPYNQDPDDPDYDDPGFIPEDETPNDPSTLFNSASINVTIEVSYFGDKSTPDYGGSWIYKPEEKTEE